MPIQCISCLTDSVCIIFGICPHANHPYAELVVGETFVLRVLGTWTESEPTQAFGEPSFLGADHK